MATPNYSYEKRQRELAKKRKTEEKRARKANPGREDSAASVQDTPGEAAAPGSSDSADTALRG
jgi:hypothetical protein